MTRFEILVELLFKLSSVCWEPPQVLSLLVSIFNVVIDLNGQLRLLRLHISDKREIRVSGCFKSNLICFSFGEITGRS